MFFRDLNLFINAFAFTGPMFGKPSRMNWSWSFSERGIFCLREGGELFCFFDRRYK